MAPVTHVAQRISLWFARKSVRKGMGDALSYGVGIVLSAAAVIPLLWMLSTALKDMGSVFIFPPQWIPDPIVWENFGEAMTFFPFGLYYLNTCKITFTSQSFNCRSLCNHFYGLSFSKNSWAVKCRHTNLHCIISFQTTFSISPSKGLHPIHSFVHNRATHCSIRFTSFR